MEFLGNCWAAALPTEVFVNVANTQNSSRGDKTYWISGRRLGSAGLISHPDRLNLSVATGLQQVANVFTRWVIGDFQAETICQPFVT